jgi:lipopolysaccharide export system permease protein
MTIWRVTDRYFFWDTFRTFLLILCCFFALFFLIDYSSRTSGLHLKGMELGLYYYHVFIRRFEVLIPFALLVAVIRVLCQANSRYELAALMACGISLKRALWPILLLGILATTGLYLVNEYVLPTSMHALQRIEDVHMTENNRREEKPTVHSARLSDGTHFLYQTYDVAKQRFLDVFWIRTLDDLYRIRHVYPQTAPPYGDFVEHFQRNAQGELILVTAEEQALLPELFFDNNTLHEVITAPGDRALTTLWKKLPVSGQPLTSEQANIESDFYRKMVMPWLGLLACLAPCAACARFRRPVPTFYLYCGCLAVLVIAYLWLSAGSILAHSQVLAPKWTLGMPMFAALLVATWRWARLR